MLMTSSGKFHSFSQLLVFLNFYYSFYGQTILWYCRLHHVSGAKLQNANTRRTKKDRKFKFCFHIYKIIIYICFYFLLQNVRNIKYRNPKNGSKNISRESLHNELICVRKSKWYFSMQGIKIHLSKYQENFDVTKRFKTLLL